MAGVLNRFAAICGIDRLPPSMAVVARVIDGLLKSQGIEAKLRTASVTEVNAIFRDLAARSSLPDARFALVETRYADGQEVLAFMVAAPPAAERNQLGNGSPEK